MLTETTSWFGPATITAAAAGALRVDTPAGEREAVSALGYPYRPAAGDVALVIADEDRAYIVGILSGRGRTVFEVGGDLLLRAGGTVRLQGARGVEIEGPRVSLKADKLETIVRTIFERAVSCYRWVKETLQTHAGRTRTMVDGTATISANRIVESAQKEVKIDGKQIHLG